MARASAVICVSFRSGDIGGNGASQGKYLELPTNGQYQFIDSGTGSADIVFTMVPS